MLVSASSRLGRMDTATATLIIYGSAAILLGAATWLGWLRYRGRIDELPAPLRGPGGIVALITGFVGVMLALLVIGVASN